MRVEPLAPAPGQRVEDDGGRQRPVEEQSTQAGVARGGHLADQGTLHPHDRDAQPELARVGERGAGHPPGDDRDRDARLDGRPHGRDGPRPDPQVIADQGAVEVERYQPDRAPPVARHRRPPRHASDAGRVAGATRAIRGSPARSATTSQPQPGRRDATAPETRPDWSAPISRRARPAASSLVGKQREQAPDDVEPVGSAVKRLARLEPDRCREAGEIGRADVGQVGAHQVEAIGRAQQARLHAGGGQEVGHRDPHVIGHAVRDRVLGCQRGGPGRAVGRDDLHLGGHAAPPQRGRDRDRDGAAPGPDVGHAKRRRPRSGVARGPARRPARPARDPPAARSRGVARARGHRPPGRGRGTP